MQTEKELRELICEIGRRLYQNGFAVANDGNISVKVNENEYLCTPSRVSKGFMTPDMLCLVDGEGAVLQSKNNRRPSSEMRMHLRVYRERPDVCGVVHAHPPYATAHAICGIPLAEPIIPESVIVLGNVPIAKYGTPSTDEIPDAVAEYLQTHDAVLLENHGALTWSADLMQAYLNMESLEFYAKLLYLSKKLGTPQILNNEQVVRLYDVRRDMGFKGKHPANNG